MTWAAVWPSLVGAFAGAAITAGIAFIVNTIRMRAQFRDLARRVGTTETAVNDLRAVVTGEKGLAAIHAQQVDASAILKTLDTRTAEANKTLNRIVGAIGENGDMIRRDVSRIEELANGVDKRIERLEGQLDVLINQGRPRGTPLGQP